MRFARVRPTTSPPVTTRAHASRAPSESRRRARSVMTAAGARSSGSLGAQRVAEAAHGPDQLLVARIELSAQVADVRLDHVVVAVEVVLPDVVEDLLLRQHTLGVQKEVAQKSDLGGREPDLNSTAPDLVSIFIHLQVAVAQAL